MKFRLPAALAGLTLVAMSSNVLAQTPAAELVERYGCTSCHAEKASATEGLPIGPAFETIAARYFENNSDSAYQGLFRVVKHGSSPYSSAYKGEISGLAMPPNEGSVSDLDINRMLVWILDEHRPG